MDRLVEKIDGTKAPHSFVVDELDYLKRIYTKEQLQILDPWLWKDVLPTIKNIKPYIVYLGNVDGVELYQVNGDATLSYITGRNGAMEADRLLRKAAEEYGNK